MAIENMKLALLISTLFFCSLTEPLWAQQSGSSTPVTLETILPSTPEAASLTKYSDFPVGMFTGTPTVSIPLLDFKAKHLDVPLTLEYTGNGVKVDDVPSKTGMTWVLNAGGVVSRTIYDKPDEMYPRLSLPPDSNAAFANPSDAMLIWLDNIIANNFDMQFDEYAYNFNGHSGKFIINLSGIPQSIPYSNDRIEVQPEGSVWRFRITTPDGIRYYFGQNGAYETIQTGSGSCGRNDTRGAKSAWYLTRIENPNDPSDYITFQYTSGGMGYTSNVTHTVTYWDPASQCSGPDPNNTQGCGCGPTPCLYGNNQSYNNGLDQYCINELNVASVHPSSITSSSFGKIKFGYIPSVGLNAGIDSLVSTIQFFQDTAAGKLLRSFNLNYTQAAPLTAYVGYYYLINQATPPTAPRPFLSQLQELDSSGAVKLTHSFQYNNLDSLPERLSFAQDYWGYFNGVKNGQTFIPEPQAHGNLLPSQKVADRNPYYNYAAYGMLSQVNFPTGGYVQFQYEGNSSNQNPESSPPPTITFTPTQGGTATNVSGSGNQSAFGFYLAAPAKVNVTYTIACCSGGMSTCAKVPDATAAALLAGSQGETFPFTFQAYNQRGECSYSATTTMTLPSDDYTIQPLSIGNYQITISVAIDSGSMYAFYNPTSVPSNASLSYAGGGLRVKQQIQYDPVSGNTDTTSYIYNGMIIPFTPTYCNYLSFYNQWYSTNTLGCIAICPHPVISCNYAQFSSNSSMNTFGRGGSPVYYTQVTENVSGNNISNGGTEHYFSYYPDENYTHEVGKIIPNLSTACNTWKNGQDTLQKIFKWVNGNKVYIKTVASSYSDDPRRQQYYAQFVVQKDGTSGYEIPADSVCSADANQLAMTVYDIASYSYDQVWNHLDSTVETDYDMNGQNPVVRKTWYVYDDSNNVAPTRTCTIDSKKDTLVIYNRTSLEQSDINTSIPLSVTAIAALDSMVSRNMVGITVETEKYVHNMLYNKVLNDFKVLSNGLVVPDNLMLQNASNLLETRIQFSNYDAFGDLLQQEKMGDVIHSYIWDYESTVPIAEVLNASPTDIAYTSFEADGTGNWTIPDTVRNRSAALSGNSSYILSNGSISKSGLNSATNYIVSYWLLNSSGSVSVSGGTAASNASFNGWTYYEVPVSGASSVTVSGTGTIDELRLYPKGAQMSTYTYAPLIGMTTHCDPSGHLTFYTYDGLGRLHLIKDQYGNILKRYDYEYQTSNN